MALLQTTQSAPIGVADAARGGALSQLGVAPRRDFDARPRAGVDAGGRRRFHSRSGRRLGDDPRHHRAVADVPRRLWRHGQPGADDRRRRRRLHDRGVRRELAARHQPVLALVGGGADRDRHRGRVRHAGRRALGAHRGHLHDHDHARDRGGVLLSDPAELADLQRLQRFHDDSGAALLGINWQQAASALLPDPVLRRAELRRRHLHLAGAVRARAAGRARQSAPHGGDRLQRHRPPHRRLRLRGAARRDRRHPVGVAQQSDLPLLVGHRGRRSIFSSSRSSAASAIRSARSSARSST